MKILLTHIHAVSHRLRLVMLALLVAGISFSSFLTGRAQTNDAPITVSSVAIHSSPNGNTVVTVGADGPLNRAQTWQDRDGFHVVVPDGGLSDLIKSGKGIRVRRSGSSIEILVLTKPGTSVGVQVAENRLNLNVEGRLLDGESASEPAQSGPVYSGPASAPLSVSTETQNYPTSNGYPAETSSSSSSSTSQSRAPVATGPPAPGNIREAGEYAGQDEGNSPQIDPQSEGALGSVFSGTGVLVFLGVGIVGFLVVQRRRSRTVKDQIIRDDVDDEAFSFELPDVQTLEPNASMVRSSGAVATGPTRERKPSVAPPPTVPASLFGAYRIGQEVTKLISGHAHRMEVLSSRATEDRRAIEASLVKTIIAADSTDDERRRARGALEEYGFVARHCAQLLLAPDAFERTSAARSLAEIGSAAALPFLLESLYDPESIVRNQAVVSIGELKVPSAIGALLDLARKHPDIPSNLISRALNACSVDGLDFFGSLVPRGSLGPAGFHEAASLDLTHLEPSSMVEDLPDDTTDPDLAELLANARNAEANERSEAARRLGQYEVRNAVETLSSLARHDPESAVRSYAVSSLASINHESVFPAVLIALADEMREVRASAARALSRLSFDRADAYVRVIETSDSETLTEVAEACVKAGVVSQNIDRLDSSDHRQAYEAFSLISLLVKAKMPGPIIDAICHHEKMNVRLSAIHLLSTTGDVNVLALLRNLIEGGGISEELNTALLDAIYKLEQSQPRAAEPVEEFSVQLPGVGAGADEYKTVQALDEVGP